MNLLTTGFHSVKYPNQPLQCIFNCIIPLEGSLGHVLCVVKLAWHVLYHLKYLALFEQRLFAMLILATMEVYI